MSQKILPPSGNTSTIPDKATRTGMPDHTGKGAEGRVLHLNLWFFKYGTDDKSHAAAILLSLLLLIIIVVVILWGMDAKNTGWADKVFSWLGSAFLFVTGIALGGKENGISKKTDD